MIDDDNGIGHLLTRRTALRLFGSVGGMLAMTPWSSLATASAAATVCLARPQQTEGPYFVEESLQRSDIRADSGSGQLKAGVPLTLRFLVTTLQSERCQPLAGAQVDLWHCDAHGVYSDVRDASFNTVDQGFLRGYQLTNEQGEAQFTTIFPGWYPGRTVHFHFKIRNVTAGQLYEFTSQLYFDDALIDRIHAMPAYASRGGRRSRNHDDRIFRRGGEQLLLKPVTTDTGYVASLAIGLQLPASA